MKRICIPVLLVVVFAAMLLVPGYADTVSVTTVDGNGNEITKVQDENGNTLTIQVVNDQNIAEAEVDWSSGTPAPPTPTAKPQSSANSGGAVSGGGNQTAASILDDVLTSANEQSAVGGSSGAAAVAGTPDPEPTDHMEVVPENGTNLVDQIASALPESVQQALSTETDEAGNPVVSSRLVTLLLIIILVLLLIIVAGIVLVIVLVVTRRKNADKPGKRAGKHTAGVASAGHEEEETQETQPEE